MISAPLRFGAATCLVIWLLGFSVAVIAQVCSCCDTVSKGCGSCGDKAVMCGGSGSHTGNCGVEHSAGCCDKNRTHDATQTCGSSSSGCSLTALELKPALPFALCDGLFLSLLAPLESIQPVPRFNSAAPLLSSTTHRGQQAIPPELRLGSALWSHAPPQRAA